MERGVACHPGGVGTAPTGTVAFLFTDLEGSTRLWEEHGEVMAAALELHDDVLRQAIERHDGYVFTTAGDMFAAAFESCAQAAAAASAAQNDLADADWSTPDALRVRAGLHVGEAHERNGDYFGPTLNRAARIMSVAHGGQTVASSAFTELLGSKSLRDLGQHRLKDLSSPEQIWQLDDGEHPPLRTLDAIRHNLPVERTRLVGRDAEIERLGELIESHRLVSVLGMGGTGKTRLATAAAADVADRFPGGVWFVDLVPVTDSAGVVAAIAAVTGMQIPGSDLLAGLADVLSDREVLFVLDNCEHITDSAAEVIDELLTRTSAPRFVATSREPMDLVDEAQLPLEPLGVADAFSPAVELFTETAARVGAAPSGASAAAVVEICAQLDGHPLSIELAAAQLKHLSVDQLAERLDQRFELLNRRGRGRRHESLIAILDDTWAMLDAAEQAMLLQVAAFPSAFALEDAEGVCGVLEVGLASSTLRGLIDRSLVVNDGEHGHRLLETIKLFARGRWVDDGPSERLDAWVLTYLSTQDPQARYVSDELANWLTERLDTWQAVERRLAAAGQWEDLGDLFRSSHILLTGVPSSPWAMETLTRVVGYLDEMPDELKDSRAALNLSAAQLGLPSRRPDIIAKGSDAAIELMEGVGSIDLAYAKVIQSWMAVFRDVEAAIKLLDEAFELAESLAASDVADVALGYKANHLGVVSRIDEAREVLAQIRQRPTHGSDTYGTRVFYHVSSVVNIVRDPPEAARASKKLLETAGPWAGVLASASLAAAGEMTAAVDTYEAAFSRADMIFSDDGFPDLLIPLAAAAYSEGDKERARMLLSAVRHAPNPTQNFLATTQYRELRNEVGLAEENPLESRSMQEIFEESWEWMQALA